MATTEIQRSDPSDGKSGASPSGPGTTARPKAAVAPDKHPPSETAAPRNTPPDNPFDTVKTQSNE
ncbi:MAG: hypothetical protein ABW106_04145 [Steroidobacteraceae bacterium]